MRKMNEGKKIKSSVEGKYFLKFKVPTFAFTASCRLLIQPFREPDASAGKHNSKLQFKIQNLFKLLTLSCIFELYIFHF